MSNNAGRVHTFKKNQTIFTQESIPRYLLLMDFVTKIFFCKNFKIIAYFACCTLLIPICKESCIKNNE